MKKPVALCGRLELIEEGAGVEDAGYAVGSREVAKVAGDEEVGVGGMVLSPTFANCMSCSKSVCLTGISVSSGSAI